MNLSNIGKVQQLKQQQRSNSVISPKDLQIKQIYSKVPPRNGMFQLFGQQLVNKNELQLGEPIDVYIDKRDQVQSMQELSSVTEQNIYPSSIQKCKKQPLMPFPNYAASIQQQQNQDNIDANSSVDTGNKDVSLIQILKQQDILIKQQSEATQRLQRLQNMRLQKRFKPVLKKNISNKDYGSISPKLVNYYEEKLLGKYKAGKYLKQITPAIQNDSDADFNNTDNEDEQNDFD